MRGTGGDTLHAMRAVPRDTVKERPWETRGKSVEGESMENVWVQVGNNNTIIIIYIYTYIYIHIYIYICI